MSKPVIKSAADLKHEFFAPLRYVVPKYFVEGCILLAGPPKVRKSWMVDDICIAVATGGKCLGEQCTEGDVLLLALEDSERRLKNRFRKIMGSKPWPERLEYATEWPRANEGGLNSLKSWLRQHPKARLVVIDVLQGFRPKSGTRKKQQYEIRLRGDRDVAQDCR